MRTTFQSFTLNSEILRQVDSPDYIFLLHGFTGSLNDWKPVSQSLHPGYNIVGMDIIGHGQSDSPEVVSLYSASSISSQLHEIIKDYTDNRIVLAGYSMGGRAALSFAVNFPHLLKGLILESCSPGLDTLQERTDRIKKDDEVIKFITDHTLEEFTDFWMNLDIFNTQRRFSDEKRYSIRKSKLSNNKTGLINSLKGFGSGVMPSYRENLPGLDINTLIISGELDTKYIIICTEMASLIPNSKHVIIPSAGHNTHLEEPDKYIQAVNDFLANL